MSKAFRLIALDLDGTTLDPQGRVSPRTRDAIAATVANGTYVMFATGRNLTESRQVLAEAGHRPMAIFAGGAQVVDTREDRPLLTVPMHGALARELTLDLESLGHAVLALQDALATGVDYLISSQHAMDVATSKWLHLTKTRTERRADLATYRHEGTLRISVVVPAHRTADVASLLRGRYAGRVVWHGITVAQRGVDVIEIFDPTVTKWTGIQHVAGLLGISEEETITVGDDMNDLPMLGAAGLGVAMGNANDRVKATAKRTIGHNGEDGLAAFLEEMLAKGALATA